MKVLVPENCLLWTSSGFCIGKDLGQRTEIFAIDAEGNLVIVPIEGMEEPEEYHVRTMICKNSTHTVIPNYRISHDDSRGPASAIKYRDILELACPDYVKEFTQYHNDRSSELVKKSPFSVNAAFYLGKMKIDPNRHALCFDTKDQDEASEFKRRLSEDLGNEFGGEITRMNSAERRFRRDVHTKYAKYMVFYRSEKLYNLRSGIKLDKDIMDNALYSNGINIYFGFLRGLFESGFVYHLPSMLRGYDSYRIVVMPWTGRMRKLIQNSCHIWRQFQLLTYESRSQRNIDELKIESYTEASNARVLETRDHRMDCYEIDVPAGYRIIADNVVVEPVEMTDEELAELMEFEGKPAVDFAGIRTRINAGASSSDALILKKIIDVVGSNDMYHIHIVGRIKAKGRTVREKIPAADAILYDDTGEIKVRLLGDIANRVRDGDILEISGGYTKNGRLLTSRNGHERIHSLA